MARPLDPAESGEPVIASDMTLTRRSVIVRPGRSLAVTKRDIERFTCGDCHFLARAIQKRTGWPIHAFVYPDHSDEPYLHAFVVMRDGRVLDVQGACTIDELRVRWKCQWPHREFTWRTVRGYFGEPEYGHGSYTRARVVAERLLAAIAG